eukprot:5844392-Prorocentrum_lima.AAC.1
MKGKFTLDEALSPELKDLLRRMLRINQGERASMPDILNHPWMRMRSTNPLAAEADASQRYDAHADISDTAAINEERSVATCDDGK